LAKTRIVVIFIVSRRVDAMVRFYRDIVGLRLVSHNPGDEAWFDSGAVRLAVHRPQSRNDGKHDLLLETDTVIWFQPAEGVRKTSRKLRRKRLRPLLPKRARNYLFLRDPEGRLLGFHEPSPHRPGRRAVRG
jgi:catechol 2,3-dioxygenase-like lactoylglutathione lyase family enzyme